MHTITITVIKTPVFAELQKYVAQELEPCPSFQVGQTFTATHEKPEGFCDWAWNDLYPYIAILMTGGSFQQGVFENWMVDEKTIIACCTDGVRPVVFELKRDEAA